MFNRKYIDSYMVHFPAIAMFVHRSVPKNDGSENVISLQIWLFWGGEFSACPFMEPLDPFMEPLDPFLLGVGRWPIFRCQLLVVGMVSPFLS